MPCWKELDESALIRILTEPKNAITKQYKKLFDYDGIELEFEKEALDEVAKMALAKKAGARGLRAILEHGMLDIMYEVPAKQKVAKVIMTKDSVLGQSPPRLVEGKRKSKGRFSFTDKTDMETAS